MSMTKKISLILIGVFVICQVSFGQDNTQMQDTTIEVLPVPEVRLSYYNPMNPDQNDNDIGHKTIIGLDNYHKELLQRIADIYRIHILSLQSEISNDALDAEKYINQALSELQKLMNDYPDVQSDRRFAELYRTVMTEYQEFYGIKKPINDQVGDIFAIRDQMFSLDKDWFDNSNNNTDIVLPENVTANKTEIPLPENQQVKNHLAYLWIKHPEVMERWLERGKKYLPMMKQIFVKEGLPPELVYLAMIESGLVPYARSRARAVGMWQFIRSTGRAYGLEINWWVDERRDPVKSTYAAARYLKDLYNHWGNWHLAMANYNLSSRWLNHAIRMAGGVENYWKIYPYLPRETRGYVPSYIAAALIAMHPKSFGFKVKQDVDPYSYSIVDVKGSVDLNVLAKCVGISTDSLKALNPELLRWATPPGNKPYPLKIPQGTKNTFLANYQKIPASDHHQMIVHTVKRGETLGYIANRYGTSVRALYAANSHLSKMIYPGQKIAIPLPPGSNTQISPNQPSLTAGLPGKYTAATRKNSPSYYSRPSNSVLLRYTVKRGDNVGYIAEWYDTYAWKIRTWNHIGNMIRPGERLRIYVPRSEKDRYEKINDLTFSQKQSIESKQHSRTEKADAAASKEYFKYVVKRNDSLSDLANTFNTTIREIKRLNHMSSSRIYVGQTLLIKRSD